jgi:integrase
MVLAMVRPTKHKKTGMYYFRQKVPADIRAAFGKMEVTVSLHTKDVSEAKLRCAEKAVEQAAIWQAFRAAPGAIPHKTIMGLLGEYRRGLDAMLEEEPGEVAVWDNFLGMWDRAKADAPAEEWERWYGGEADSLLRSHGLSANPDSRARLIAEMHNTFREWGEFQRRRAGGDYRPDAALGRYPSAPPNGVPQVAANDGTSLGDLFSLWERRHRQNGKSLKTVQDFRSKVNHLIGFLGHDDAKILTGKNLRDWRDALLSDGLTAKTVREKYLVAVKAVLQIAVEEERLPSNAAIGIKVAGGGRRSTGPRGYSASQAAHILRAVLGYSGGERGRPEGTIRAIRWVPWICAYTGARVAEITQLRKKDFKSEEGIDFMEITPEAGAVKSGKYRRVPVHSHLIEMGLLEMVRALPEGPIFFTLGVEEETPEVALLRAKNVGAKVGQWVQAIPGIDIKGLQPNYAWRHRFKTECRGADVPEWASKALQGHSDDSAAGGYGEFPLRTLRDAIERLARVSV